MEKDIYGASALQSEEGTLEPVISSSVVVMIYSRHIDQKRKLRPYGLMVLSGRGNRAPTV